MVPALHCNGRLLLAVMLAVAGFAAGQETDPPPPGYYRPKFSPSMAIVIVVLIATFFFLGFFSFYVRRNCYGERTHYSANRLPIGAMAVRSRRHLGLDKAILDTFLTMAYADVKEHKGVKGELECAVCLSEFDDDETLRLLPKCSHVFHPDCIDTWLASHVTCPVCRANLVPDPDAPAGDDIPAGLSAVAAQPQQETPAASPAAAAQGLQAAVVINVEETEEERIIREETDDLTRIGSLKRALRSKSCRTPARLTRSHSTGHSSAAQAGSGGTGAERFTLRLPEHVLREVITAGKLRRTTSLIAFTAGRQGSTRGRGLKVGCDGSSRVGRSIRLGQSGRWPSFVSRTFSASLPPWVSRSSRRGEADGSSKGGKAGHADVSGMQ